MWIPEDDESFDEYECRTWEEFFAIAACAIIFIVFGFWIM